MMLSWQRIRLRLRNFDLDIAQTHRRTYIFLPQVSSFLSASLISKNQSAALRQCRSTCIYTLLIRAQGTGTYIHSNTYVNEHLPWCASLGDRGRTCTPPVIKRWRNTVRERDVLQSSAHFMALYGCKLCVEREWPHCLHFSLTCALETGSVGVHKRHDEGEKRLFSCTADDIDVTLASTPVTQYHDTLCRPHRTIVFSVYIVNVGCYIGGFKKSAALEWATKFLFINNFFYMEIVKMIYYVFMKKLHECGVWDFAHCNRDYIIILFIFLLGLCLNSDFQS